MSLSRLETYTNGPGGIEQQWHFAHPPPGRGALEVSVGVSGPLVGESSAGLHFRVGGRLVKYGHATWVDAAGVRTAVQARFDAGAIHLTVPEAVLDSSTFPAVLDPVIGPEFAVDAPVFSPASEVYKPAVATDGSTFLVVWRDFREGTDQIYAARVLATGELLDPTGFSLMSAAPHAKPGWGAPAVAWNGSVYLVAWSSWDTAYASRVDPSGAVLDAQPRAFGTGLVGSVASDGANFLVASAAGAPGVPSSVFVNRITTTGASLDATPILVGTGTDSSIAWNGSTYLVVWNSSLGGGDDWKLRAARVSSDGVVLDSGGVAIGHSTSHHRYPSVASDGHDFLVTWQYYGSNTVEDIGAVRVSANGVVLDPTPLGVSALENEETQPFAQWDGSNYLVVWRKRGTSGVDPLPEGLLAKRISTAGAILDPTPVVVAAGPSHEPNIITENRVFGFACGGTRCLVVYLAVPWSLVEPADPMGLFGVRLGASASVLDPSPFRVSLAANAQWTPSAAWNGSHYLLAWEDARGDGGSDIHAVRVTRSGAVIDALALPVSVAGGLQARPRVASNGADWLVTWEDGRVEGQLPRPFAARVTADGGVLDPQGFPISTSAARAPDVAALGANYFIAWVAPDGGVRGRRVSAAGLPLDSSDLELGAAQPSASPVAVSSSASSWAAAWTGGGSGGARVLAGRVASTGAVLDPGGVLIGSGTAPALASDGTGFLVTRHDASRVVARLFPGGTSDFLVSQGMADAGTTALAFDGDAYLAAWSSPALADSAVRARRISKTGVTLDGPNGFLLGFASRVEPTPALACSSAQCVLASSRYDDTLHVPRVFGRALTSNLAPHVSARSLSTAEDTPALLAFAGFDADGDSLSFRTVQPPTMGQLVEVPPNGVRYVPARDFHGTDSFTYVASDQLVESSPALVTIAVSPTNDPPIAAALSAATDEDAPLSLRLEGADVDGDPLSFRVLQPPRHGTLTGAPPDLVYTPTRDFNGEDSFEWVTSDGVIDSDSVHFQLLVTPVNDGPVAESRAVATRQATAIEVPLEASDVDGDALTYDVVTAPAHGTLSGTAPSLRYVPAADFTGVDVLRFRAFDGQAFSAVAEIAVTVAAGPDAGAPDDATVPAGCGCSSGDGLTATALLFVLQAARRRRRARAA